MLTGKLDFTVDTNYTLSKATTLASEPTISIAGKLSDNQLGCMTLDGLYAD